MQCTKKENIWVTRLVHFYGADVFLGPSVTMDIHAATFLVDTQCMGL